MMDYPQREAYFAMRFIRLLVKTAAAMEIGQDGVVLLTIVASQEDACRYTRPVNFYNGQLCHLMAIPVANERQLRRVRERCEEAGWLKYEAGNKRQPGRYFVTIPPHALSLRDGTSDEKPEPSVRESVRELSGECPGNVRETSGQCPPSIPSPSPKPREERDAAPSADVEQDIFAAPLPLAKPATPRVAPTDLPILLPGLTIPPADRAEADILLRLYGHGPMETVWPALTGAKPDHRVTPARDPKRVWLSELRVALQARFALDPEDYQRAGLPVPQECRRA